MCPQRRAKILQQRWHWGFGGTELPTAGRTDGHSGRPAGGRVGGLWFVVAGGGHAAKSKWRQSNPIDFPDYFPFGANGTLPLPPLSSSTTPRATVQYRSRNLQSLTRIFGPFQKVVVELHVRKTTSDLNRPRLVSFPACVVGRRAGASRLTLTPKMWSKSRSRNDGMEMDPQKSRALHL